MILRSKIGGLSLFLGLVIYITYFITTTNLTRTRSPSMNYEASYLYVDNLEPTKCEPKHNIAFLKTHKCASSSVQNMLFRYGFKNNLTFALPSFGNYFGSNGVSFRSDFVTSSQWNRPNINIYAIHTKWDMEEMKKLMQPDTMFISIIRDPTEMYESLFSYAKFRSVLGMPLAQYVAEVKHEKKRINGYLGYNQMAYDFGLPNNKFDLTTLNIMLDKWDDHFHLVMLADRIEESLILLKDLLCWEIQDVLMLKMNSRKPEYKIPLSIKTKLLLRKRLKLDYVLYDHFVTKFNKAVDKFGKSRMAEEVSKLRTAVDQLAEKCEIEKVDAVDMKGPNKPYGDQVTGFQSNTTDNTCRLLVMNELYFIRHLLNRQKIMKMSRMRMDSFITGAIRLDQKNNVTKSVTKK